MSTLGFALLGLLARRPATGYDLARDLRRPVGYFWHAQHSQIDPTLAQLEADGLVTHQVVAGPAPRPTKRYRVTRTGRSAVRRWLRAPTPEVDDREILLRVYLVWLLPPGDAVAMLGSIKEHHALSLDHYLNKTDIGTPTTAPSQCDPLFGDRATLEWGSEFERTIDGIQHSERP